MQYKAVILGASTGGPNALRSILKKMPKDFPIPIIIVQRIPQGLFAESLAEALDDASPLKVSIMKEDHSLANNEAVLIPGGFNILLKPDSLSVQLISGGEDPENCPSISKTIAQVSNCLNGPIILTILTGICLEDELVDEIKKLSDGKVHLIAQTPETCFIEDLPQTIIQAGLHDEIVDLDKIGDSLCRLTNTN